MSSLDEFLQSQLLQRENRGLLRSLKGAHDAIDFFSNDYLGLARSTELSELISRRYAEHRLPNGSTGSRLLGGNYPLIEQAEDSLKNLFRSEACLLFNSGYSANIAVLSSIPGRGDTIVYDELAHASLKDGARLSLARHFSFRHNDPQDLEKKLNAATGKKFVVLESVYSMDGDDCLLEEIVSVAARLGAHLILDEAHTTGVVGKDGSGMAVARGLDSAIAIRIYTFGKAMGVHGACVAGSSALIRYLVNFARPLIYTTAPSPHHVLSILCAFEYLAAHPELQEVLQAKIRRYLQGIGAHVKRTESTSPIQTVIRPGNEAVKELSHQLLEADFDVRPILSPTVPAGSERLRICLHTYNDDQEIDRLTEAISRLTRVDRQ